MATCPECDADIEVDEFDVDKGDLSQLPGVRLEPRGGQRLAARARGAPRKTTTTTRTTTTTKTTTTRTRTTTRKTRKRTEDWDEVSDAARARKQAHLRRRCSARCRSVLVAYSGGVDSAYLAYAATARSAGRGALRHRRQPQLPAAPPRPRGAHRARVRPAARDHPHRRARAARVPRQPGEPLLLLQARALHAPRRASPRSAASR